MKVDFSDIRIEAIDGSLFPADEVNTARQQLCNRIWGNTCKPYRDGNILRNTRL